MTDTPSHELDALERKIWVAKPDSEGARFVSVETRVLQWLIDDSRRLDEMPDDWEDAA